MFRRFTQLRASDVLVYRLCDGASGVLILIMAVFSPWAFGSTEPWSMRIMNNAGYTLGGLLLIKLFIRKIKKFPAPRWNSPQPEASGKKRRSIPRTGSKRRRHV
jgi:hypothetical protein